jgi:integrase
MVRTIGRLTALKVEKAKKPGMYCDGGGLYLRVTTEGTKSWVYRYKLDKRPHWMGLGPLALYGLQEARQRALDARKLRHEGLDPIESRRALRAGERLAAAKTLSFKECATCYIRAHRAGWRNAKHAGQWEATLATYADPVIGALPVQSIDTALVMKVLEPIWREKPETANRLRGRTEAILNWAKVQGYRDGENPARWRGHLDKLLPARSKIRKVEHHAALPYQQLPAFLANLREQEGVAALALEFAILTAARSGEVLGAQWGEIDTAGKLWTIPAARMKAGKDHRVPLSPRALAILEQLKPVDAEQDCVFPGKSGKPLNNNKMVRLVRQLGHSDLTVHGFRSTFRDWAAERTNYQNHIVEMALAHAVGDKVEAAYRRSDLFEKRRKLLEAWTGFCASPVTGANLVSIGPLQLAPSDMLVGGSR